MHPNAVVSVVVAAGVLFVFYLWEVTQLRRNPQTYLRFAAIPWGRPRSVGVHTSRFERLQAEEVPDDYRRSARGTTVGRRLRVIRSPITCSLPDKDKRPSVLQPGPRATALLLMYGFKWAPTYRFLFEARVVDDAGAAEVRTFALPRLTPLLALLLLAGLVVLRRGHVPIESAFCFAMVAVHIALGLRRAIHHARWARNEIESRLSRPTTADKPTRNAPKIAEHLEPVTEAG